MIVNERSYEQGPYDLMVRMPADISEAMCVTDMWQFKNGAEQ